MQASSNVAVATAASVAATLNVAQRNVRHPPYICMGASGTEFGTASFQTAIGGIIPIINLRMNALNEMRWYAMLDIPPNSLLHIIYAHRRPDIVAHDVQNPSAISCSFAALFLLGCVLQRVF